MDLRCRMDVINLYQCDPGFCTGKRVFDYHYLLYVHSGKGRYRVGERVYPAAAGDLFYCPPGEVDDIMADRDDPFLLSGIEFVTRDGAFLRSSLPPAVNLLPDPFCAQLVREMIREYTYGMTGGKDVCGHLLAALILRAVRLSQGGSGDRRAAAAAMLDYIHANLERGVSCEELAQQFSYHKNTVNRMLREATGTSLRQYQIRLRLQRASDLLAYSGKSVQEVAELCGYRSAAFFSRQYRQKTGASPTALRGRDENGS